MPTHARGATSQTRDILTDAFGSAPFTHADLATAGITRGQLRAAQAQGYITTLRRGLFVVVGLDAARSPTHAAQIALNSLGGVPGVVAGHLAGRFHGTPFVTPRNAGSQSEETEVLVLQESLTHFGRKMPGLILRPVDEWPDDVVTFDGIPVTGMLHTAIDLVRMGLRPAGARRAKSLSLPEALVVLDATSRSLGDVTTDDAILRLAHIRPRFRQGQGIRAVDAAAPHVDPRAESPLESWSRGHMIVYGVPLPLLQEVLIGADGMSYRVDFCWPEARVIAEADGLAKYGTDPQAFRRAKAEEIRRQRALEAMGWRFVRWTWDDIASRPAQVMRELNQVLAQLSPAA